MNTAFASPRRTTMHHRNMENSQPHLSTIPTPPENSPPPSSVTPHSDHRYSLIAGRFRDALFSAAAAKYATNGSAHSLPFPSEQFKSVIECCLHQNFPSFRTPTHLPYASMIQKAIAEVGEEDGLSEELISEFIVNEYKDLPWAHPAFLRRHLGKLCESGELVKSKCGKYNFKVEGKEVKRKKRRRKSAGRSRRREVESDYEIEGDIDRIKRSKKLNIRGPCAEEVVTSKGSKEKNDSLREVIVGAEDGDHALRGQVVLDELEEVQEDEMIDKHHREEIKYKYGANDFNLPKKSRNLVIIGLHAPVAIKGIEKQSRSLGGKVHEAEEGDHAKGGQIQVLGDVKEVQADVMIDQPCEKEVKSRHVIQDIDEKRQSQTVAAANLGAQEALAMTGIEAKCGLSREEIGGLMKVRKVGMINDPHKVEVKSTDRAEDFGEIKQSQDLMVVGLHAKKALATKGTEDQCSLLRKNVVGAEGDCEQAGQTEVLGTFKGGQEVEMIDEHHEEERQGEMMEEPKEVLHITPPSATLRAIYFVSCM